MIRIIFFALIVFLVFKVANMAWQSLQAQRQPSEPQKTKGPRSVNDWPQQDEPEVLLPEQDMAQENSYWQKKIQDAYRRGYKDGLDDGKGQGDGMR